MMRFPGLTFLLLAAAAAEPQERWDNSTSPLSPQGNDTKTQTMSPDGKTQTNMVPGKQPAANNEKKMHVEFHFSNKRVEVGDLWLWDAIRSKTYDAANYAGVQLDNSYDVSGAEVRCIKEGKSAPKDLNVRVQTTGEWGQINDVNGWDVRSILIDTLWELANKASEEYDKLFSKCKGPRQCVALCAFCHVGNACDMTGAKCWDWSESLPHCGCNKKKKNDLIGPCFEATPLMTVPSSMSLKIYNSDGSLRADSIEVQVSSVKRATMAHSVTCGKLGAVAEVGLSFIPVFGSLMEKAVKVICREEVKPI